MREHKFEGDFSKECLDKPGGYSVLNFASIEAYFSEPDFDRLACFADGILMAAFVSVFMGKKVRRVSFDFTSIADLVFGDATRRRRSIYIIGASDHESANSSRRCLHGIPR